MSAVRATFAGDPLVGVHENGLVAAGRLPDEKSGAVVARFAHGSEVPTARGFDGAVLGDVGERPHLRPEAVARGSVQERVGVLVLRGGPRVDRLAVALQPAIRVGDFGPVELLGDEFAARRRRVIVPVGRRRHAGTVRLPCQKSVWFRANCSHSISDAGATRSASVEKAGNAERKLARTVALLVVQPVLILLLGDDFDLTEHFRVADATVLRTVELIGPGLSHFRLDGVVLTGDGVLL